MLPLSNSPRQQKTGSLHNFSGTFTEAHSLSYQVTVHTKQRSRYSSPTSTTVGSCWLIQVWFFVEKLRMQVNHDLWHLIIRAANAYGSLIFKASFLTYRIHYVFSSCNNSVNYSLFLQKQKLKLRHMNDLTRCLSHQSRGRSIPVGPWSPCSLHFHHTFQTASIFSLLQKLIALVPVASVSLFISSVCCLSVD